MDFYIKIFIYPNQRTKNVTRGNTSKVAQFRGKTANLATLVLAPYSAIRLGIHLR